MIVVMAIDALEHEMVERFDCINLKQRHYGKTDITEFSQPRTMVLWSSFMTGENKEKEILAKGDKEMWNTKWAMHETFFSKFERPAVLDLPGFSYDKHVHERSRSMLKEFFKAGSDEEKEHVRHAYNKDAFDHHRKVKEEFMHALGEGRDFVLGYFSVADVVGHLNFGDVTMMKMIYRDLDELAAVAGKKCSHLLILSDHGMKAVGRFGDHSEYGFWSTNFRDMGSPKITDFAHVLTALK